MTERDGGRDPVPGREEAEAMLRQVGDGDGERFDIGAAALALASFGRGAVDLARYREHLAELASEVRALAGESDADGVDPEAALFALNTVIVDKYGYRGDRETYDDLQNANMLRVIDRRRGLPVALGILYIATARAQQWDCVGLSFPGHFLIRLATARGPRIIDPFNGGQTPDAAGLRDLLRVTMGEQAKLAPDHYAPVSDRSVLLRLQNNVKLRLIGNDRMAEALEIVETMLLFAPREVELWREAGMLYAHQGNLSGAVQAIEHYLAHASDEQQRHRMAAFLQRLRLRFH